MPVSNIQTELVYRDEEATLNKLAIRLDNLLLDRRLKSSVLPEAATSEPMQLGTTQLSPYEWKWRKQNNLFLLRVLVSTRWQTVKRRFVKAYIDNSLKFLPGLEYSCQACGPSLGKAQTEQVVCEGEEV